MRVLKKIKLVALEGTGRQLYLLSTRLYPICNTLATIQNRIALKTAEVSTGTPVFDWIVPMKRRF